jgi:ABC-type multidrug transport system permease subunit
MLAGQVRHANHGFWRTPVAAFFTLLFPLSFLVILSAFYGNEVIDPSTGLRLAQYTTPVFAVFGACMACYVSLASALAYARASGVLKRLRGTPLPPSLHIAGRILSSMWVAAIAVVVMVAVGVAFYAVQIIAENVPALVLTFLVGTACFAALGLAVAAVAPTPNAATAFGNASLILLAFVSGIFGFGDLPDWMERVASVFPLKPFAESFADGFNPYIDASTPDWGDLAVMAAWGIAGAIIARRAMSWEPTLGVGGRRRPRHAPPEDEVPEEGRATRPEMADADGLAAPSGSGAPGAHAAAVEPGLRRPLTVQEPGPPGLGTLVARQTRYAAVQLLRDPMSLFFAIAFPVLLVVFFSSVYGEDAQWGGMALPQYLAAAFAVYGVATSGFVNLPGSIAEHRALGVLKRLRGSPLPPWGYLAGRVLAALVLGLFTVLLVFAVAVALFAVTLPPATWPATLLTFALAIVCFAACGLALVAVVDQPQAVIAATLSILLPLSFISDIFIAVDQMPPVLDAIGWLFPLRHAVAAAVTATSGGALDATFWGHLVVLVAWTIGTALVAWRFFHWELRQASAAGRRGRRGRR